MSRVSEHRHTVGRFEKEHRPRRRTGNIACAAGLDSTKILRCKAAIQAHADGQEIAAPQRHCCRGLESRGSSATVDAAAFAFKAASISSAMGGGGAVVVPRDAA